MKNNDAAEHFESVIITSKERQGKERHKFHECQMAWKLEKWEEKNRKLEDTEYDFIIIIILKSIPKIWVDYYREISSNLQSPTSCLLVFLSNFPLSFLYPF